MLPVVKLPKISTVVMLAAVVLATRIDALANTMNVFAGLLYYICL